VVTCIFTLKGIAWWIVFGVIGSNPPNNGTVNCSVYCNVLCMRSTTTLCVNALCVIICCVIHTTCLVALQPLYVKDLPTEVNIWQVGMYLGGGGEQ